MYQYAVPDSAKDEALIHSKALKYADSFTTESKQEFSIIPVKSIGVLASDIDLVCAIDAVNKLRQAVKNTDMRELYTEGSVTLETRAILADRLSEAMNAAISRLYRLKGLDQIDVLLNRATAEAALWRRFLDKSEWLGRDSRYRKEQWSDIVNWRIFLSAVLEHPEYLPYINVGIRDIPLIERLLVDDVDPSLAIEVIG